MHMIEILNQHFYNKTTEKSCIIFDLFDLLMSTPSETSILSYCSMFITHTSVRLKRLVDNTCCRLVKQT